MDNSLLAVRVINHKYIVVEKSCTVSVFAIRNFKFLGFALGRNGKGIYVRVHPKSWKKFKSRLKELSSRKRCQSIKPSLEKIKVYARGWLNYYGIASMKNNIDDINGWLYHRIRMCIWKQWKKPRTKEQFNAEIEKGMEDIKAGRVYSADEVEAEMKREFGI